jgi:hypothetical protein
MGYETIMGTLEEIAKLIHNRNLSSSKLLTNLHRPEEQCNKDLKKHDKLCIKALLTSQLDHILHANYLLNKIV